LRPSGRLAIRRLALARAISVTGSNAAAIALSYEVFRQTGSPLWLSASLFFTLGVTGLLAPLAGVLVDRTSRKALLIASDAAGASCWLALAFVHRPVVLIGLGFLASVAELPFVPASGAAVPNLVDDEPDLAWANARLSVANNVGHLLGPSLGGLLVAAGGASLVFVLNALSFLASAGLVARVQGSFAAGQDAAAVEPGAGAGFRQLLRNPVVLRIAVASTVLYLAVDMTLVADVPLARSFGWGAVGYGLMDAFWGGGALLGALLASRVVARAESLAMVGGTAAIALAFAAVSAAPWFALVLVGTLLASASDAVGDVAAQGIVQRQTPDAVRGRVLAALSGAGLLANAAGFVFAGFAVSALGPSGIYAVAAVAASAATLVLGSTLLKSSPARVRSAAGRATVTASPR
jgi:MFS family permease